MKEFISGPKIKGGVKLVLYTNIMIISCVYSWRGANATHDESQLVRKHRDCNQEDAQHVNGRSR